VSKLVKKLLLSALTLVLLAASGCSAPQPAGLTDLQVAGVTENISKAMDANDYQAFIQDFSQSMLSVFTQAQFDSLRAMLEKASGKYVSHGSPSLSNNQGYAVFRFPAKYTNETVYVTITFLVGGQKVEGLFFDSANLRKVSK
jgi:Protein of unknown function (DUF3887)